MRRLIASAMLLAVWLAGAFTMAACYSDASPLTASVENVRGLWCGDDGDKLYLDEDGTMTVDKPSDAYLRVVLREYPPGEQARFKGQGIDDGAHGTWEISLVSNDAIGVGFDNVNGQPIDYEDQLRYWSIRGQPSLLGYAGDPDEGYDYRFRRCS